MHFKMGFKLILAVLSVSTVSASMVNLTSQWKLDHGWEITCSWRLFANDSLQSVRLSDHERQFLIYRPELHGPNHRQLFQPPGKVLQVECYETSSRGVTGRCVMTLELYQPSADDMQYACEVSGERPLFRMDKKDIQIIAMVPPSGATIEVAQQDASGARMVLNCTSSGLPAPTLMWSIGEQKVPQDFSGKTWNATSMLWNTWSLLSYSSEAPAICKPETSKSGQTMEGASAMYSAGIGSRGTLSIIAGLLSILALGR